MLLTISTTHKPATDLGFLLHKNPGRTHAAELSFGNAYVFYPEATEDRCTMAVLIDVDPVKLVRSRKGPSGWIQGCRSRSREGKSRRGALRPEPLDDRLAAEFLATVSADRFHRRDVLGRVIEQLEPVFLSVALGEDLVFLVFLVRRLDEVVEAYAV